jgi:serine/threonine-protein kinase
MNVAPASVRYVGRYAIYDAIATGGMATVHLGRLVGPVGFARTVAIKCLHAQFARDPEFVTMFLDEARLAARIQHPNVVPTLDVIPTDGELFIVMEYVRGEALSKLVRLANRMGGPVPPRIAVAIVAGALAGLHAAHEARDEGGTSLGIVHRDVSPQNVLVGVDGVARVLDFGVAKAGDTVHVTKDGQLKGKLLYMAPEQLEGEVVDRRADIYAMGIVLFEALTGERMFKGDRETAQLLQISRGEIRVPSEVNPALAPFDPIVRKASARMASQRYATAREMARALEDCAPPASAHDVGEWVEMVAGQIISERTKRVMEIESGGRLDRDSVRSSLQSELARSSIPDAESSGVSSGISARRSVPEPTAPTRAEGSVARRRRVPIAIGVGVFVLLVGGAALAFALRGSGSPPPAVASVAVALPSANASVASVVAPATASASAAPREPAPTGSTASATLAELPPAAPTAAAPPPSARGARPKASASASAGKPDCEQPYVVDSAGHMHFRQECL